jgi:ATP-dependent Clp protease protease subunit
MERKIRMSENTTENEFMDANGKIEVGLLNNNIHFLTGDINEYNIEKTIKWIIYENTKFDESKQLTLYINSGGGELSSTFALIDIMRSSPIPIRTVGIGAICSAAFMIFACGERGHRIISKNTSIMCHQYSGGFYGKHHDIEAYVKEATLTNSRLVKILEEVSDMTPKKIKDTLLPPSDVWLTPEELVELGIADSIQ